MSLSSDEVNFLIYRYLLEAGFTHSAFVFGCESSVSRTTTDGKAVPLGALLMFIQKGFQFMELEANLNDEGTDVYADYTPLSARDILTKDISELRASVRELRERQAENGGAMPASTFADDASELAMRDLTGHNQEIYAIAYSEASNTLASAGGDGRVRVWDVKRETATVCGDTGGDNALLLPLCLDWSPDGELLAAGSKNSTIVVWNKDGTPYSTLSGDTQHNILCIKWNKKGDTVLTGDGGGTITVWDIKQNSIRQQWSSTHGAVFEVEWKNNIMFAAGFMDGTACTFKLGQDEPLRSCPCYEADVPSLVNSHDVNAVRWDSSGKQLAAAATGSTHVWLWSAQGEALPKKLRGHKREVMCVVWGGIDSRGSLASGSNDGAVRLWDPESGNCTAVLDRHLEGIRVLAWSPDGVHLAAGDEAGNITIWHTRERRVVKSATCSSGIIGLLWILGGDALAVACDGSSSVVIAVFVN